MVNKTKIKSAFTLAEVLITLVIIGIVAALTIPTAISKYQKQQYVAGLKKAYSVLSQVTNTIIAEEGSPKASVGGWASSYQNIFNLYKKHLNNAKECIDGSNCYNIGMVKNLDGSNEGNRDTSTTPKLILNDGTTVLLGGLDLSSDCSAGSVEGSGIYKYCASIFVDVNGARKPNKWGRDNFQFFITEDGLKPRGCGITNINYCHPNGIGMGHACACKVLQEGAMNY